MEKARHNKSGLIQMNLLIDKAKNGDIQYKRNTEKFCPIMLAGRQAALYHFQTVIWKKAKSLQ